MKKNGPAPDRRHFIVNVLSSAPLACLGCSAVAASLGQQPPSPQTPAKHKFQEDSGMTLEAVFNFAFKEMGIPVLMELANQVGREEFVEMLKEAASKAAVKGMQELARNARARDLATYLKPLTAPTRFWKQALTWDIVENSDKSCEIRVKECLWAKTFREANAGDIGYACVCHGDFAAAPAFNPKMKMTRTKTLMQGHDCCNHRWVLEA